MKKLRQDESLPLLPADVLIKIVQFLRDAKTVFEILDALSGYNVLGPLEYLRQLGQKYNHSLLWPSLNLCQALLHSRNLSAFEAIVQLYLSVVVHDDLDTSWLKLHIDSTAQVALHVDNLPEFEKSWNEWMHFRIARLTANACSTTLINFLLNLRYLKALTITTDSHLQEVLEFAANHSQLVELQVFRSRSVNITRRQLECVFEWFIRQPVRVFGFSHWIWGGVEIAMKQEFFKTILTCPTMDRLHIASTEYHHIDVSTLVFSMRSLVIERCNAPMGFSQAFAKRLEFSNISDLTMNLSFGHECILDALPRTSIKSFKLSCGYVYSSELHLRYLAPFIENCQLEIFGYTCYKFTSEYTEVFAAAILKTKTIRELDLSGNYITNGDKRKLLECATDPKRQVKMMKVKFNLYRKTSADIKLLEKLASRGVDVEG
ncbi:hypothetical protein AeMF1_017385 [Aphanomyces euteiches]|nr:hypothetical protein AeMF1_017385 [Aphanomyces euteiches]